MYSAPSNVITPTAPVIATTATITFNANGGTGTMANETEPYNTSAALTLNAFTYTGYTFNNWNSEANGDGTTFTNGELVRFRECHTVCAVDRNSNFHSVLRINNTELVRVRPAERECNFY